MNEKQRPINQFEKVILILEERLKQEPNKLILKTLFDKYDTALNILENNNDLTKIRIKGGCRAYLDSYSDYTNSLLIEMSKAEEALEKTQI